MKQVLELRGGRGLKVFRGGELEDRRGKWIAIVVSANLFSGLEELAAV